MQHKNRDFIDWQAYRMRQIKITLMGWYTQQANPTTCILKQYSGVYIINNTVVYILYVLSYKLDTFIFL